MYGSELVKAEGIKELSRNLAGASEIFTLLRTVVFATENEVASRLETLYNMPLFQNVYAFLIITQTVLIGYTKQLLLLFVWV